MRLVLSLMLLLFPTIASCQSRTVLPEELVLHVEVDATDQTPVVGEMVLITVKGIYRRHITREEVIQPDFDGFNWTQLGSDTWRDERLNGEKVKTFSRRMAIFPNKSGQMTVGRFTHKLTLTDERDDWFEHRIMSEPVTFEVQSAPETQDWWFPVASLKVSDQWSNAPDQLQPGEGVLRVMRVEALGVTPEMIPPMPDLTSPSAMIFPHPEKRFVELSPAGPVSYAFWRWTIRPSNDTSAIVEPLSFNYFDTGAREHRSVTISAQRVAYGTVAPDVDSEIAVSLPKTPARLPGWPFAALAASIVGLGIWSSVSGRHISCSSAMRRWAVLDPLARRLTRAERVDDLVEMGRMARAMIRRDGPSNIREDLIRQLDQAIFGIGNNVFPAGDLSRRFIQARDIPSIRPRDTG